MQNNDDAPTIYQHFRKVQHVHLNTATFWFGKHGTCIHARFLGTTEDAADALPMGVFMTLTTTTKHRIIPSLPISTSSYKVRPRAARVAGRLRRCKLVVIHMCHETAKAARLHCATLWNPSPPSLARRNTGSLPCPWPGRMSIKLLNPTSQNLTSAPHVPHEHTIKMSSPAAHIPVRLRVEKLSHAGRRR